MDSLVLLLITACLIYNSLLALIVDDSADLPSLIQIDGTVRARKNVYRMKRKTIRYERESRAQSRNIGKRKSLIDMSCSNTTSNTIQHDAHSYARTHRIQLRLSVLLGRGKPTVLLVDLD